MRWKVEMYRNLRELVIKQVLSTSYREGGSGGGGGGGVGFVGIIWKGRFFTRNY